MFVFLTKTLICSSLFYGLYYILLRKETFFHLNRLYLLATLGLAVGIPLLQFSINLETSLPESFLYSLVNSSKELLFVYILDEVVVYGQASPFSWYNILEKIYFAGIFIFSARILLFLYRMLRLSLQSRRYKVKNVYLYVHNQPYTAFSFGNAIYVNKNEFKSKDFKVVWKHELTHIQYGHTFESLFLELWTCVFWFNPFVWAIKNTLRDLHEYQTDQKLVKKGIDSIAYQKHLLNYTLESDTFGMANHFAATALKGRITMLAKKQSSFWKKARFSFLLPIVLLLLMAFSTNFTTNSFATSNSSSVDVKEVIERPAIPNDTIPIPPTPPTP